MTGHMILKKTMREGMGPSSSTTILGLKVVGGQLLPGGGRGAIIEKVKKGSTADIDGQLRPGKQFHSLVSKGNLSRIVGHCLNVRLGSAISISKHHSFRLTFKL